MHLANFTAQHLGPVKHADLPFVRGFNALVGVNGAGKSTLLNAIALMLGRYSSVIRTDRVSTTTFDREQIKRGATFVQVTATISDTQRTPGPVEWSLGVSRAGRETKTRLTNSSPLIAYGGAIARELSADPYLANLPIAVYYPAQRAILDIPVRVRGSVPFEQLGALEGSLTQTSRSFREFFSWFREREDLENEKRLDGAGERDPELTAVRRAIAGMLPGFENLRVKRSPLRMLINKGGLELQVDRLSDGEKSTLALAGDLARRLATANPGRENALEGDAVVLIDELELHLHPAWQREAVKRLSTTFPNCQFIVSTHSPQVLSEVNAEGIFLLRGGEILRTDQSRGRSSNLILEELMGVPARPDWAREEIDRLYEAIDDEEFEAARDLLVKLEKKLGEDEPGLTSARTVLLSHAPDA